MKIEYRTGNLFDDNPRHVVHSCNDKGVMKSGIAKEIRERYPDAYRVYRDEYEQNGLLIGQVIPYGAPDDVMIFNLIGQHNYGRDGHRYVSYDGIAKGLEAIDDIAHNINMTELFMPLLGAGLGGGSWQIIKSIIERHSENYHPIVYLLDGIVPST